MHCADSGTAGDCSEGTQTPATRIAMDREMAWEVVAWTFVGLETHFPSEERATLFACAAAESRSMICLCLRLTEARQTSACGEMEQVLDCPTPFLLHECLHRFTDSGLRAMVISCDSTSCCATGRVGRVSWRLWDDPETRALCPCTAALCLAAHSAARCVSNSIAHQNTTNGFTACA